MLIRRKSKEVKTARHSHVICGNVLIMSISGEGVRLNCIAPHFVKKSKAQFVALMELRKQFLFIGFHIG